jgi:ATP-dependent Lhr-like helicase
VLRRYDSGNLLLGQAEREVLEQELELTRLRGALARMRAMALVYRHLQQPTPFAFPLLVERLREQVSTEDLADRIARMVDELEQRAAETDAATTGPR